MRSGREKRAVESEVAQEEYFSTKSKNNSWNEDKFRRRHLGTAAGSPWTRGAPQFIELPVHPFASLKNPLTKGRNLSIVLGKAVNIEYNTKDIANFQD